MRNDKPQRLRRRTTFAKNESGGTHAIIILVSSSFGNWNGIIVISYYY